MDWTNREVRQRFYNSKTWQETRLWVLNNEPLCRSCIKQDRITAAVLVDHIVPLIARPDLRIDRDNLQSLCRECHDIKTAAEQKPKQGKIYNLKWKKNGQT